MKARHRKIEIVPQLALASVIPSAGVYDRSIERRFGGVATWVRVLQNVPAKAGTYVRVQNGRTNRKGNPKAALSGASHMALPPLRGLLERRDEDLQHPGV